MIVTYRNNRLMPVIITTACIWALYILIYPSIELLGDSVRSASNTRIYDVNRVYTKDSLKTSQKGANAVHVHTENNAVPGYPATLKTASFTKSSPVSLNVGETVANLTENDVLLIMKTGATTIWKRLLIHLSTTFSPHRVNPQNIAIYSDQSSTIGPFTVIDALENTTEHTKSLAEFSIYRDQAEYDRYNAYVEASGVPGDDWGPPGGWIIDKYKFVPLIQHAGNNWPRAKWYVYMEDDTFIFLPNLLRYLGQFDWQRPHYLGHFAAKSDVVFAHGGAGFALSRGAWEASFGRNEKMSEDLEEYTTEHCCGDQVLAKALNEYGVKFGENGGDEKFNWGFNPLVHWATVFDRWNWCSPLMSWHKVHSRDVARYYELERRWDFSVSCHFLFTPFLTRRILH